jgi:hypothetical protein
MPSTPLSTFPAQRLKSRRPSMPARRRGQFISSAGPWERRGCTASIIITSAREPTPSARARAPISAPATPSARVPGAEEVSQAVL